MDINTILLIVLGVKLLIVGYLIGSYRIKMKTVKDKNGDVTIKKTRLPRWFRVLAFVVLLRIIWSFPVYFEKVMDLILK